MLVALGRPEWLAKASADIGPGCVTGAALTASEPTALANTWTAVRGMEVDGDRIALDGGELRFVAGECDGAAAFHVEGLATDPSIGGFRFISA